MSRIKIYLLFFILLVASSGCSKEKNEFRENTELRERLQGSWLQKGEIGSVSSHYYRLTFVEDRLSWNDSTVFHNEAKIQVVTGNCPVRFGFRDGYNPYNTYYLFETTNADDILWVLWRDGQNIEVRNYSFVDGQVIPGESFTSGPLPPKFIDSYLQFSNNFKTAGFCTPRGGGAADSCITYDKEN